MSGESGARNRHGDMRSSAASVTGRSSALSNTPASLVARVAGSKPLSTGFSTSGVWRSEEHTSELQSLMRISYAVFCLKKKKHKQKIIRPMYNPFIIINSHIHKQYLSTIHYSTLHTPYKQHTDT